MTTGRLEAFSDGVIAIIITIMVLELRVPHEADLSALRPLVPVLLSYVLSFVNIGIYWSNHHHMMHLVKRVNGAILWANLHLLFWLSLMPFATAWMGENHFAAVPTALYGVDLLASGMAYFLLQRTMLRQEGAGSLLASALGRDRKGKISLVIYAVAVAVAFIAPWIAWTLYLTVALVWFIPDRRAERALEGAER
jgi:uncharacterized membrane protein